MVWWLWVLLGLGLLALEMATPGGFFALFFGVSALVVGVLVGAGAGGPGWVQWLLFSLISVAALLTLRRPLQSRLNAGVRGLPVDSLLASTAVALEELPAGGIGKVELRGSAWSARNNSDRALAKGQRCTVEKVDGLTLWVRAE
jgi:membrane protein implicated in regulation of membrane protease activity